MSNSERRIVEYERLNLLGKAVFLGGSAVRLAAEFIDSAIDRAVDIYVDAERAFRHGMDPNVEDAKIIQERED